MAETLINALSKVAGLSVSARSSAFTFRGRENDLKAIGAQLGVSTVLVGGIQRAGDKLRITARAVRVANDSIIWSDNFDRPSADIFAVQDEVARAVVAAMRFSLTALPDSTLHVGGTKNTVAYDAYLRGRFFWNLRTTDGMVRATDAFKAAIAADSNYAQAWSGLADAYTLSTPDEYDVPGATYAVILPLAGAAARRAIAIAPGLGEAYSSLGEVMSKSEQRADALAAFRKGVALSPSYATGHQWYSYELLANGLVNDAVSEMEVAHRLDPLSHVITLSLALMYDAADRFGDAAPLYAQGLAQSPQAWYGWRGRFLHDLARGQMDSAAVTLQHVAQDPRYDPPNRGNVVRRMAPLFIKPTTRAIATDSIIRVGPAELSLALTRAFLGDTGIVTWLQRATIDPDGYDADQAMITNAVLGPRLRADPRIQVSFRRLGFPGVQTPPTPQTRIP